MTTAQADVLIVGAGLAGLHTATRLAERGHDVVLADRRADLTAAIRTTGIFVRKTLDDFPLPRRHLGPGIRTVLMYPPSLRRPVTLTSPRDEFRLGDMGPLYVAMAQRATAAGVHVILGARYRGSTGRIRHLATADGDIDVTARFLVGADGARSAVARDLGLDTNRHLLVGAEEVFPVAAGEGPPAFHCVIDPSRAPGYLAWVVNDGEHAHVGIAGYHQRFPGGLRRTLDRFVASAPGLEGIERPATELVERRGGPIPVGGVLRRIACPDGLLVGDAAGAVSPLTAGGLDPCLRLSEHAAELLHEALYTGSADVLRSYDGAALRARFRGRLTLRHGLSLVRTPAAATAAFALLRTPPGRAAAKAVLFGDRSFPSDLPEPSLARRPRPGFARQASTG